MQRKIIAILISAALLMILQACRESMPGQYSFDTLYVYPTLEAMGYDPNTYTGMEEHDSGQDSEHETGDDSEHEMAEDSSHDTHEDTDQEMGEDMTHDTEDHAGDMMNEEGEHVESDMADEPDAHSEEGEAHDPADEMMSDEQGSGKQEEMALLWSYSGDSGPEHWGSMGVDYTLCASGQKQSPVDIVEPMMSEMADIEFDYHSSVLQIADTGHTIQVDYDPGSTIHVDGVYYELQQIHFHGPSEHTIDGIHYSMEVHLVHETADGHLAVVAILAVPGAEHAAYEPIWDHFPVEDGAEQRYEDVMFNASDLLPMDHSYYNLEGSLTTPPCTEGVQWYVMKTPVEMSVLQIADFGNLYINNFRPVQALHERTVYEQE